MRNVVVLLAVLSCSTCASVVASYCYPDYCQNLTTIVPTAGFQCLLTRVKRDKACVDLKFDGSDRAAPTEGEAKFSLSVYVRDFGAKAGKATAFNMSVTDITFHRLITRYQNLLDEKLSACRHIELYGNETHFPPTELYVSCPFSDSTFERSPYRLEFLVTGKNYEYNKQYVFNVPMHKFIGEDVSVKDYTPFVYADVSEAPILSLYIQPVPETRNVTQYRIVSINNCTGIVGFAETVSHRGKQQLRYSYSAPSGAYYFKVAALHDSCDKYGCANGTTPVIIIKEASHPLLIMIISIVWIPPVILYVVCHLYKLYRRKEALKRAKKQNCLLIYSPTRLTHMNVMTDLAKYLRGCNIDATIDLLDNTDTSKDAATWCTTAFRNADTILVAASPPVKQSAEMSIYRNAENHLLRLLSENCAQRDKTYYSVQFPYCKSDDVPEAARTFKRFYLPKELTKLVKAIQNVECIKRVLTSDKQLLDSIKLAKLEVLEEDVNSAKEETDELLTAGVVETMKKKQLNRSETSENNSIPLSFMTNIDELNLLGESGGVEQETFVSEPATSERTFRIDELNL